MNLGKLVREKMKAMSTDLSGEYVDNHGKHFKMSVADDGYVIGYGGETKREVEVTKPQAMKLVAHCRKLGAEADEKKLAKKKLASGKILWWDERDGNGIVKDGGGNEWYIDTSVIKSGKPKSGAAVTFEPHPVPGYKYGTRNVQVQLAASIGERVEKKLAQGSWSKKNDYWEKYFGQDYRGKVYGWQGDKDWKWELYDDNMHVTANGVEMSPEKAMSKCDAAAASRL